MYRQMDFEIKDHQQLGAALGILDFEAGAAVAGTKFAYLCGAGALLELALIAWASQVLRFLTSKHILILAAGKDCQMCRSWPWLPRPPRPAHNTPFECLHATDGNVTTPRCQSANDVEHTASGCAP